MPILKRAQAELLQRLVLAGVPGETASIVGAACYDQKRLSPRFFGAPTVDETEARTRVEHWLVNNAPAETYQPASEAAVQELVRLVFP